MEAKPSVVESWCDLNLVSCQMCIVLELEWASTHRTDMCMHSASHQQYSDCSNSNQSVVFHKYILYSTSQALTMYRCLCLVWANTQHTFTCHHLLLCSCIKYMIVIGIHSFLDAVCIVYNVLPWQLDMKTLMYCTWYCTNDIMRQRQPGRGIEAIMSQLWRQWTWAFSLEVSCRPAQGLQCFSLECYLQPLTTHSSCFKLNRFQ